MTSEVKIITLPLPYRMGHVNCYLVTGDKGYVLIDTGGPNSRKQLEATLENNGCKPGNLDLIIITHGDFDHTGNAAHLRAKYNAKIAGHRDDAGMAEHGDMFAGRKKASRLVRFIVRVFAPVFFGFGKSERFIPDILTDDNYVLSIRGLEARIVATPGHSKGSISILTADGCLFCGDLLTNEEKPSLNSIIDNPVEARASVEQLKSLNIRVIYPGHGKPFTKEAFIKHLA